MHLLLHVNVINKTFPPDRKNIGTGLDADNKILDMYTYDLNSSDNFVTVEILIIR